MMQKGQKKPGGFLFTFGLVCYNDSSGRVRGHDWPFACSGTVIAPNMPIEDGRQVRRQTFSHVSFLSPARTLVVEQAHLSSDLFYPFHIRGHSILTAW
jgi:hypothetical protein